ncbi:MAG: nucleotidyltransferase family protein [bacterium]|nr:nucleotidyltransferase family protein [bacterium]MCP5068141.1 nucleotidyltransferase family protein [bacterium]
MKAEPKPFVGHLAAVLLAAGGSRRLGRPKQLLVWRGEPLVRRAARAILDAGVDELVVVLGAEHVAVAAALDGLPLRRVTNPAWAEGIGSSIACGVDAAQADAVLLLLADQPGVDSSLLRQLVDAGRAGHTRVACHYAGVLGVPALFANEGDLAALGRLEGDRGAQALLANDPSQVFPIAADQAAFDLDDERDWAQWKKQHDPC